MNERTYHGGADRLRLKERIDLMEIDRVVSLSLAGIVVRSVLDVGAGTGLFAEAFAQSGLQVAGIDINENLLVEARKFVPAADFKVGSMENIPFDDKSFDLVFLGHVLHEAGDLSSALTEALRVAQKRVVVLEWPPIEEEMGPPLSHRLQPEAVIAAAQKAGFAKVHDVRLKHMGLYLMEVS